MLLHFMGESHAAQHFKLAASIRGFQLTADPAAADLIFVSEDTPTDADGNRDLLPIRKLMEVALAYKAPIILTSQVLPGFTRSYNCTRLYHQSETLRIKDALIRAVLPEQIIMGSQNQIRFTHHTEIIAWAGSWDCPVQWCDYETAEFSKIAINMTLASQVVNTNRLAAAAAKAGANWERVRSILSHDKRIGPYSYLTPGRWQDSKHLLRDYVTLKEIEGG